MGVRAGPLSQLGPPLSSTVLQKLLGPIANSPASGTTKAGVTDTAVVHPNQLDFARTSGWMHGF
jgi:hypothetical protein